MIGSWLAFPVLLAGLALGCGLLLQRVARLTVPGPLVVPAGLALIVVAGQLTTSTDATAELTVPLVVALSVAGFAVSGRWWSGRGGAWWLAPAIAAFLVYGAPVVVSGEPTFAGYIRLDDTSTWLALTDRVMEHGHSLEGLAPSTYEATLAFNLGDGYPVGVFLPLGIGHVITGIDSAWLIQPYMSLLAACIALCLWELLTPLVPRLSLRAVGAGIGAQPALLVGYAQWGGIKEVAAAALIALCGAIVPNAVRAPPPRGWLFVLGVGISALLAVLSLGGAIWVLPALVAGGIVVGITAGVRTALIRAGTLALVVAFLSLPLLVPALLDGRLLPPTSSPLTDAAAKGNLLEPLGLERLFGIWPAGDFRLDAVDAEVTAVLILVVAGAAAVGLWYAISRRALGLALFGGGTLLACLALVAAGSPWVDGKSLAIASTAALGLGVAGATAAISHGRGIEGGMALVAIATGVLWSNALAYRDANLAPREQLAELEMIGERIAAEGPALLTEYQTYGARHFLREADAEAVSELRRREIPLRSGEPVVKGYWADTDALSLKDLLIYRTLVLRRSPVQSRPPAPYARIFSGEYYEVWQRAPEGGPRVVEHLPLGGALDPGDRARCGAVRRLARAAGDSGTIAAAEASPQVTVVAGNLDRPRSWGLTGEQALVPVTDGTAATTVTVPRQGVWRAWLRGSIRGRMELRLDGVQVGAVEHLLNNADLYAELGSASLEAGEHELELDYTGPDMRHPGSGGTPTGLGPLILTRAGFPRGGVRLTDPSAASELCGGRFDWLEALR